MKISHWHGTDGLTVESFNVLDFSANSTTLHNSLFDVNIAQQGLFSELLASFLENDHACIFLPNLKMFFLSVQSEVVDLVETVEDPLFLKVLLKLHELNLVIEILGQASF